MNRLSLPVILLFLLGALPFTIPYQYRPNPVFPSEVTAFVLTLVLSLIAFIRKPPLLGIPHTQIYWLLCASFLAMKLIFQPTLFYEFTLIPLLFMLTAAAASYALNQFRETVGFSHLADGFLVGIVLGSFINTVIAAYQVYTSITLDSVFIVYGGIGQRNMYGNYLMGGFIALIYLATQYPISRWLSFPFIIWFAQSLAWAGSRSVLLYLVSLGLISIWMRWRKPALRDFCRLLLIGILLVLIAQLFTPYLNAIIGKLTNHSGTVLTAFDRLTANGSRRLVEWQKAWEIFKAYPWLGAGWGSFAGHSMQLHAHYPEFYRVIESVLFTHAHNGPLHILAENGSIGGGIILGGLMYLLSTFCFKVERPSQLALSLIVYVTLLHSLVEYPLWYFHFFVILVICLSLLVPSHKFFASGGSILRSSFIVYIAFALTIAGWGWTAYYSLSHWQRPSQEPQENTQRLQTLKLLQKNPLIDFHATLTSSAYIDANHSKIVENLPLLQRLNRARPYPSQLMNEAILEARAGSCLSASLTLKTAMFGYPDSLPYFESILRASPHPEVKFLLSDLAAAKREFEALKQMTNDKSSQGRHLPP